MIIQNNGTVNSLRTLNLLKVPPEYSSSAAEEFDRVELRIGRRLPASIREWYTLDGACELLRQFSNDDRPLQVNEFGLPLRDTDGGGPHDLLARDLLPEIAAKSS